MEISSKEMAELLELLESVRVAVVEGAKGKVICPSCETKCEPGVQECPYCTEPLTLKGMYEYYKLQLDSAASRYDRLHTDYSNLQHENYMLNIVQFGRTNKQNAR